MRRRYRYRGMLTLSGILVVLAAAVPARGDGETLEYAVKATYLYKFAPFVEWPAAAFRSPTSPLVLCIVGEDPFGSALDRAVAGQGIGEHPIVLQRLRTVERGSGCHILYAAGSPAQPVAAILRTVSGTPVLTVTDEARDDRDRGIVHFLNIGNRVRFAIDDHAAAENGLVISSKLLSLATSVRPRT